MLSYSVSFRQRKDIDKDTFDSNRKILYLPLKSTLSDTNMFTPAFF